MPTELDALKFLVEIDRKGANDAVYYDCDNPDFEEYITGKGFQTAIGSFSDISLLAPELGVAAVNLSSGYYNAHTLHEFINVNELHDKDFQLLLTKKLRACYDSIVTIQSSTARSLFLFLILARPRFACQS